MVLVVCGVGCLWCWLSVVLVVWWLSGLTLGSHSLAALGCSPAHLLFGGKLVKRIVVSVFLEVSVELLFLLDKVCGWLCIDVCKEV